MDIFFNLEIRIMVKAIQKKKNKETLRNFHDQEEAKEKTTILCNVS